MKKWISIIAAFLLLSPIAAMAQTITNVYVASSTSTTATIVWTTNTAANSQVVYGINNPYLQYATQVNPALVTSHSITLTVLSPVNTYYFAVVSGGVQSATTSFQLCNGSTAIPLAGTANNYYQYGSYTLTWVPPAGSSGTPTLCGQPITTSLTGLLTGSGSFSATVANSFATTPGPGTWQVSVTDVGNLAPITISTTVGSQSTDISQQLMAAAAASGLVDVISNTHAGTFYPPIGGGGGGGVTAFSAPSGSWPSWLVPSVTNPTTAPVLSVTAGAIPNSALQNSLTTVNGVPCVLGSTCTVSSGGGGNLSGSLTQYCVPVTSGTVTTLICSSFTDNGSAVATSEPFSAPSLSTTGSNNGSIALPYTGVPASNLPTNGVSITQSVSIPSPYYLTLGPSTPSTGLAKLTYNAPNLVTSVGVPGTDYYAPGTAIPNSALAVQTANTVLGALTATTPSGLALPSCSTSTSALNYASGTGFGCNTTVGNTTSTGLTTNTVPKANGANSVINSSITDNGTTVSTSEVFTTPGINGDLRYDGVHYTGLNLDTLLAAAYTQANTGTNGAEVVLPPLAGFTMSQFVQPEVANAVSIDGVPLLTEITFPTNCSGSACEAMFYAGNATPKQFHMTGLILDGTVGPTNYHSNTQINANHCIENLWVRGPDVRFADIQANNCGNAVRFTATSYTVTAGTPSTVTIQATNTANIGDQYWLRECTTGTYLNGLLTTVQPGTTTSQMVLLSTYSAFQHASVGSTTDVCVAQKALREPEALTFSEEPTGGPYSYAGAGLTGGTSTYTYACDATGIPIQVGSGNPGATGTQPETMGTAVSTPSTALATLTSGSPITGVCPSVPGATGTLVLRTFGSPSTGTIQTLATNGGAFTDSGQAATAHSQPNRQGSGQQDNVSGVYNTTVYEGPVGSGTNYPPSYAIHYPYYFYDSVMRNVGGGNALMCGVRMDGGNSSIYDQHSNGYAANTQPYMPYYGICETGSNRHTNDYMDTQYLACMYIGGNNSSLITFNNPFCYFTPATGGGAPTSYTATTNYVNFANSFPGDFSIRGGEVRNMPATGVPGNNTAFTTFPVNKFGSAFNVDISNVNNPIYSCVGNDGENCLQYSATNGAGYALTNQGVMGTSIYSSGGSCIGYWGTSTPASQAAMYLQACGSSTFGNVAGMRLSGSTGGFCMYAGSGASGTYESNSSASCYLRFANTATAGTLGSLTSLTNHFFTGTAFFQPTFTVTGTFTNGSNVITSPTTSGTLVVGQTVSLATGLAAGTTITIVSPLTLSNNFTGTTGSLTANVIGGQAAFFGGAAGTGIDGAVGSITNSSPLASVTFSQGAGTFANLTDKTQVNTLYIITASAAPALNPTNGSLQTVTLNANAVPTITGIATGQRLSMQICQPNTFATGYISGTTMTLTAAPSVAFATGEGVSGTGVTAGTVIVSGTYPTYTVNNSQTVFSSGSPGSLTGNWTWTWPSAVHGGMTIGTTSGACSMQAFNSFTSGTTLVPESVGVANIVP